MSVLSQDDQFAVFNSKPHFCGSLVSDVVDFEQDGEQEWKVLYTTKKPKGFYNYAAFSFAVREYL